MQLNDNKNLNEINEKNNQNTLQLIHLANLEKFIEFFTFLIQCDDTNAKIIITFDQNFKKTNIKIASFDHSRNIHNILKDSHSIIFAGGTLEPVKL